MNTDIFNSEKLEALPISENLTFSTISYISNTYSKIKASNTLNTSVSSSVKWAKNSCLP